MENLRWESAFISVCILRIDAMSVQAVDPVVLGKVRAKQYYSEDKEQREYMHWLRGVQNFLKH